ncbi:hypothetical protein VNO77_30513 [Canavalia gladiata]|uniref:Uncharacterized protein n=1 Tax=Canavalia gladiata TaxID=3824 RepID=A0AAN9Q7A0_CANGL
MRLFVGQGPEFLLLDWISYFIYVSACISFIFCRIFVVSLQVVLFLRLLVSSGTAGLVLCFINWDVQSLRALLRFSKWLGVGAGYMLSNFIDSHHM